MEMSFAIIYRKVIDEGKYIFNI